MTAQEVERLVAVETKLEAVCTTVERIDKKLDAAIENKADKTEVDELRKLVVGILIASAGFAVTTLVGLAIWALKTLATR